MKNKQIVLSAVISGCLSLSGPTFASSKGPYLSIQNYLNKLWQSLPRCLSR